MKIQSCKQAAHFLAGLLAAFLGLFLAALGYLVTAFFSLAAFVADTALGFFKALLTTIGGKMLNKISNVIIINSPSSSLLL